MFYVYILTTQNNSALYVGMTSDLRRRISEHKAEVHDGFTKKYHIKKLVYYEEYSSPLDAISREKQLKGWRHGKKIALVEKRNPEWREILF